ncbi:MAG: right-handed parallel beta-helix repeat-containing protein [Bacteroidales bacterium]|nr:right-handed parallel beta-helix repeat-containing protein [Bacteroidales bacterium]
MAVYYVATTGDDGTGDGSIGNPWKTITYAIDSEMSGQDKLYVRGGTYNEKVYIGAINSIPGIAGNHTIISSYPGESAIIDGVGVLTGLNFPIVYIYDNYVDFIGFEIRNTTGGINGNDGIDIHPIAMNVTVSHCTIHNVWGGGIVCQGDYGIIEYNTVYDASMNNVGGLAGTNAMGITACRFPDYCIIRHNIVHDIWGEGISTFEATNTIIEDNIIYQIWAVGLYVSDATDCLVQRNLVYTTSIMGIGGAQLGIGHWDELSIPPYVCARNTFINNISYGNRRNFVSMVLMDHLFVANNTFVNSLNVWCVQLNYFVGENNSFFENNIVIQDDALDCIYYDPGIPGIIFSHNLYNKIYDADAIGVGDIIADPLFTKSGLPTTANYYKLSVGSLAIGAGASLGIADDYGENLRLIPTTIGAWEYYEPSPPSPSLPLRIGAIKVLISECASIINTGIYPSIYLRWWFNGWHYFNFINGYTIQMKTESMGTQTTRYFSIISKIERPTRIKAEYSYKITLEGITAPNVGGFTGLLMAEKVEQYEGGIWREVDITRGAHIIRDQDAPGYILNFEITRDELPVKSSVYQKFLKLYIGDILCDLDDDEAVPINKQVNDIAEMQDRQSDFTAQFRIRKTREMKDLFELSGEVGINTVFPYEHKSCKLIQDGIEVITDGNMILDKVDDQYYYVAIYSGNLNFFSSIEGLKITDLLLPLTNHKWTAANMVATHVADLNYVYPLCEPSDDGGIAPVTDDGDNVEMYAGWIWPFIKLKYIWDEIFVNSGFTAEGDILTEEKFLKLFMPISDLAVSYIDIKPWLFSVKVYTRKVMNNAFNLLDMVNGRVEVFLADDAFKNSAIYLTRIAGDYTFRIVCRAFTGTVGDTVPIKVFLYVGGVNVAEFYDDGTYHPNITIRAYRCTYTLTAGQLVTFWCSICGLEMFHLQVINIEDVIIAYGSDIVPHYHLPDITQKDFIKMVCNLFGLIPEANPRSRKVKFWNYSILYDNIPIARDWSAYLSERDDEVEFKFGDYAQHNYLRYKESEDVVKDRGMGVMQVEDENLPFEKDVVDLEFSTTDEVTILTDVDVSRIAFNKYNPDTGAYDQERSIDPRLVYVNEIQDPYTSPPYTKEFDIRTLVPPGTGWIGHIVDPKKASTLEIYFSTLSEYYSALANMLNETNLRRCKFNLPVYEVAGFRHDVPIYVSQYKAYFYVNKINNYVPGQLCTIDLIKL